MRIPVDRRGHDLERSTLHLIDVGLIERHDLGVAHRLDPLADFLELVRGGGHPLLLARFGQELLGDDGVECRPPAVVQLLRRLGLRRRVVSAPAIVQLLRRDRPVADAGRGVRGLLGRSR